MGSARVAAPLQTRALARNEYRLDGPEKVLGEARYAADFGMEGMLWAAFHTSPHPHARIVEVDTREARALPGVHAVLTGAQIGERHLGRILFDWPVLAFEKVRFIGDYVAVVAAESPQLARDAAARVRVRYHELPPLFDPEAAISQDALLVHERPERYAYSRGERPRPPHRNMQGYDLTVMGEVERGFAGAEHVFEHTFTTPRYFAGYIEPRATLVWIDARGLVHVVTTNKAPFELRAQLARTTGLAPESIVIEPSFIGGDFGSKGFSFEEFACYYLARATGRPVKHVRWYSEDIESTVVRHAATMTLKSGVDAAGRFVAFDARLVYDGGAYAAGKPIPSLIPGAKVKTPYRFLNSRIERICAYTTSVPSGQVRDPAGIPVNFAIESHVDMIARALAIDPLEFRLRNAIREGVSDVDGTAYVEPRAVEVLEALRAQPGWNTPLPAGRGRGISLTSRHIGGGKTSLNLSLQAPGTILVRTGAVEQGTGTLTVVARVVATVLDVAPELVRVERGATDSVPFDPGVGGSRATHTVGRAAQDAAEQLLGKLRQAGYPAVPWERAVASLLQAGPVEITGSYDDGHRRGEAESHNFCACAMELSVDPETGEITIHDAVLAVDVGTIINPLAHRGQINGGFAFGLGHALTEELVVEDGKILNLSLAEYKLPTGADMPPLRVIELPPLYSQGPLGGKMAGELTTSGISPAIANAVADACGARVTQLPLTAERVFRALARSGA